PIASRAPETMMSKVEAQDDQTIVVYWKEPYNRADVLAFRQLSPAPRHILEDKYRDNHANFAFGEEWTSAYIGSGPFKVEQWNPGTNLIARANRDWALGQPKLDTIEIRFIKDANAVLASLLSG